MDRDWTFLLDKGREEYGAEDIARMRQTIQRHLARRPGAHGGLTLEREPSEGMAAWKDQD